MTNLPDYIKKSEPIDEGMSITDFKKLMAKVSRQGVNLNGVSATNLMFYFYNCMNRNDFKAISDKLEEIAPEYIEKIEDQNLESAA
jgi:hypothetical protein